MPQVILKHGDVVTTPAQDTTIFTNQSKTNLNNLPLILAKSNAL